MFSLKVFAVSILKSQEGPACSGVRLLKERAQLKAHLQNPFSVSLRRYRAEK